MIACLDVHYSRSSAVAAAIVSADWESPSPASEYTAALGLRIGGAGLLAGTRWAGLESAAALGALWYTSANSLGWALALRDRRPYAIPMVVGLVGSSTCLVALLATAV